MAMLLPLLLGQEDAARLQLSPEPDTSTKQDLVTRLL